MNKEVLTAEEQAAADALLLWMGREWAPSKMERLAFLKTAAHVMGYERCGAALNTWEGPGVDAFLDEPTLEAILGVRDA